jgi:signal transduction histidine kinase
MPLDSGALSTLRPRDRLKFTIQNALAIQQNVPVMFVRRSIAQLVGECQSLPPVKLNDLPPSIYARCEAFQFHWKAWKAYFKDLAQLQYAYPPSYANPGIRLLRDYWSWSWSEVALITQNVASFELSKSPFSFPANAGLSNLLSFYVASLDNEHDLILGPFLPMTDGSTAREVEHELRREIQTFNDCVAKAWDQLPDKDKVIPWPGEQGANKPVYSTDYVLRQLFSRARAHSTDIADRAIRIQSYYRAALSFFNETVSEFRPDAVSQFLAAFAAYDRSVANSREERSFSLTLPSIQHEHLVRDHFDVLSTKTGLHFAKRESGHQHDSFDCQIQQIVDTSYTAWNSFNYETFVLLRNYLNRKFGVYVTPHQRVDGGIPTKVGDRIVRMAVRLFEAEEGAIYRVNYGDKNRPLFRYGFYTEFPDLTSRRDLLLHHMTSIAGVPEYRQRSISYRAIDTQITQVCDSFDQRTNQAVPADQTLSFPQGSSIEWGRSACASPILINGQTWGVLEIISNRPWNFYVQVVKKIEEICTLIGPFFYYQGLLAALSEIYRIIVDPQRVFKQKVQEVCRILPDLFMADCAAIYFRRQESTFLPFAAVFREDLQALLDEAGQDSKGTKGLESSLLENVTNIQELIIGDAPLDANFLDLTRGDFFKTRIGHRLLAIPLSEASSDEPSSSVFGLITLVINPRRLKEAVPSSDEVNSAYEFLRTYLTVAFQLVYASYVWERSTRTYLSHEVTRLAIEFDARLSRAREATRRLDDSQSATRYRISQSLSDLESNLRDLEHFNSIFKSISAIERSDPLIAAARRLRDEERTRLTAVVPLREIVNEVFVSRQTQSQRQQVRIVNDIIGSIGIRAGRRNLREALGNLADNAIKYARSKSVIEARAYVTPRGEVSMVISNIGPMMTEEERRRVFEEGFRAQYAYENRIPGMGRGLSYAREIIRVYGGELGYRLHPEEGKTKAEGQPVGMWHEVEVRFPTDIVVQAGRKS